MARQLGLLDSRGKTGPRGAARPGGRRGVASVLAMMFLVIFGSLAVAMAVVAQGNLRTADSSLKVSRAMSAAETGIVFATSRLRHVCAERSRRSCTYPHPYHGFSSGGISSPSTSLLRPMKSSTTAISSRIASSSSPSFRTAEEWTSIQ